jgi:hypothetical protein
MEIAPADEEAAHPRRTTDLADRTRHAASYWPWLPVLFGIVYFVMFVVDLRSDVHGIYTSSDIVSGPVIGQLYGSAAPGAHVTLGDSFWFPALFIELGTKWLPAHREIWEAEPYVLSLITIGLVAWCAKRVAGVWAAVMVCATLAVASPNLVNLQFDFAGHLFAFLEVAILGAFLTACVEGDGLIGGRWLHRSLTVLVGLVAAIGVASDELSVFSGLVPYVVASVIIVWLAPRRGRHVVATALVVTVVAFLVGLVLHQAVLDDHIAPAPFSISFSDDNELLAHFGLLIQSGFDLFSGGFGGQTIQVLSVLEFLCAVAVIIALCAGVVAARSGVLMLWKAIGSRQDQVLSTRTALLTFWGVATVVTSIIYVFSTVPSAFSGRYLLPAAYGLTFILAVLAAGDLRRQLALVAGVSLLTFTAVVQSAHHELRPAAGSEPGTQVATRLAQVLRANDLKHGYAGYWDAAPLTWEMGGTAQVYPVYACRRARLCPFYLHTISSWYTPRGAMRTFLISDPTQPRNPSPPKGLGTPVKTLHVDQLTVYVYGYDIASKFS